MVPLEHILVFSAVLFVVGLMGLCFQRSLLRLFLAIEAMLNGAAFGFVGTALHYHHVEGHVMFLLVLAVTAAEVGIGLSILLHYDARFHSIDIAALERAGE